MQQGDEDLLWGFTELSAIRSNYRRRVAHLLMRLFLGYLIRSSVELKRLIAHFHTLIRSIRFKPSL